ncbi:MAG: hypothetical protein ACFFCE_00325 [Promethearchaeota archaeon]
MNEKTLELNIGAELLNNYEKEYDNCYIRGVSSNSERRVGYDFALETPQDGIITYYQFKSPKEKDGREYIFKINSGPYHDQHQALVHTDGGNHMAFYAFPLIYDIQELIQFNRGLINRTAFVPVDNIKFRNRNIEHKVYIHEDFLKNSDMHYFEVNSEINEAFLFKDLIEMIKTKRLGMRIRFFNDHMKQLEMRLNRNDIKRINYWLRRGIFIIMEEKMLYI